MINNLNEDILYHYVLRYDTKDMSKINFTITPVKLDFAKSTASEYYLLDNSGRHKLLFSELDCLVSSSTLSMYSFDSNRIEYFLNLCCEACNNRLTSAIKQYEKSLDIYLRVRNFKAKHNLDDLDNLNMSKDIIEGGEL